MNISISSLAFISCEAPCEDDTPEVGRRVPRTSSYSSISLILSLTRYETNLDLENLPGSHPAGSKRPGVSATLLTTLFQADLDVVAFCAASYIFLILFSLALSSLVTSVSVTGFATPVACSDSMASLSASVSFIAVLSK